MDCLLRGGRLAVVLLMLLAVFCSCPALATTDSVATSFYSILSWSPDEARALVLEGGSDEAPYMWRLAEMDVRTRGLTILDETESDEWWEAFKGRIDALKAKGYRDGRELLAPNEVPKEGSYEAMTLPKPVSPVMGQQLFVQVIPGGARLILQESLPGIETAAVVVADLTERLRRECPALYDPNRQDRSKDIYFERAYVSPSLQWAFIPLTVVFDRLFNSAYYCVPTFFPLADESSKLFNICGYRLYIKKQYERAEEQFVQAYYMDRTNAQAVYNLACICALTRRPFEAMDYLDLAIDLDSKYREKARNDPDFDALRRENFPFWKWVEGKD